MISRYGELVFKVFVLGVFALSLSVSPSPALSAEEEDFLEQEMLMPPQETASPPAAPDAFPKEEDLLIQATGSKADPMHKVRSYLVQAGGALPIYDEDFRDFLDYGASVTLGVKQKVVPRLYITPTLGLVLLNGDWDMNENRGVIAFEEQSYNTTYGDYGDELSP